MQTLDEITAYISERAKSEALFGGTLKFIFPEGILLIDGSGESNIVTNEDRRADCTLRMKIRTFNRIHDGKADPIASYLLGRIRLKGDTKLALKIIKLI